jgi:hypothetical protein
MAVWVFKKRHQLQEVQILISFRLLHMKEPRTRLPVTYSNHLLKNFLIHPHNRNYTAAFGGRKYVQLLLFECVL